MGIIQTGKKATQGSKKAIIQTVRFVAGAYKQPRRAVMLLAVLAILVVSGSIVLRVSAETYPGGTDNGLTSRIKTLSDSLTGLGYGSTTDTPDWGALWNRIKTAATWTPSGNVAASDVRSGKTFYNGSRTQQTGNAVSGGAPCPTQQYHDSYGAPVTQTTNCTASITWTVPSPVVTGDDKKDPVSGLAWSQVLVNNSGTIGYTTSTPTNWSWDATAAANVAVGNKTSSQLCSSLNGGGVWRLPTQKELMQAYIDGSYFNLTNPATIFWSATQYISSLAWYVNFGSGFTYSTSVGSTVPVRCVR
jgi:hypothetical protein